MVNKINPLFLEEIKKIHKLSDEFMQIATNDFLLNEHTVRKYLCRYHYLNRKKEIHRKGYEGKGNKLCTTIVRELSVKYRISEQTVWNYLR